MTKIQRSDFTGQHAGKSIDLNKLDRQQGSDPATRAKLDEAGVSVDQLRRADSNRDGKLDAAEAFKVADNFDRDEDAAPAPFQVTLGCEGLGNPAMVPVVVAMLSALPGVLGLECDTDAMTATLTLDPNVMTAEKLWTTIEGDATIRPAWIA